MANTELQKAEAALSEANNMFRDAMGLIELATARIRALRWEQYKAEQLEVNKVHMDAAGTGGYAPQRELYPPLLLLTRHGPLS
jgi:hypothetical protein